MRHRAPVALCLVIFLLAAPVRAQDTSSLKASLEEHPPAPTVSPGQPAQDGARGESEEPMSGPNKLPPGHPPIDQATGGQEKDADSAKTDPGLPAGTVVVQAVDEQDHGIPSLRVELEVMRESVREGSSRVGQMATTRDDGSARFEGLPSDTALSFRARIARDSAMFASPTFTLGQSAGIRVRMHVYPVTHDVGTARIGSVAKVYVLPQQQAFLVEAMFSIANFAAVAWVPSNVRIGLPTGAEAFATREAAETLAVVRDENDAAWLRGTVGPGVHTVVFSFQVPRQGTKEQQLWLGMPPRLVQAAVMAESAPGMTMSVRGLPPATAERSEDGRRVLMTSARIEGSAEHLPGGLEITLGGLPVTSPGRWVALLAALGLALGGVIAHGRTVGGKTAAGALPAEEVEAARLLILDELRTLEQAHRNGQVGPRTYKQARRELVDALARLEPLQRRSESRSGPS
jgi:hypothetical protein